jgi:ESS family glutamate:Na+ symporter
VVKEEKPKIAGYLTLSQEAIEPLAFQLAAIGTVYMFTYFAVSGLAALLQNLGLAGFVPTLWSFHFLIALLIALVFRKILDLSNKGYLLDRGLMNRCAGVFVDYLVVGAICAINLAIVWKYLFPILTMAIIAAIASYYMLRFLCWRAFDDYHFERFIGLFGEVTGTLNSSLVLIRVTDPNFDTPVAEDMVYGSGIGLFLGFPMLVMLTAPMNFFNNTITGYWITLGILTAYLIILLVVWRLIGFLRPKEGK